MSNTINSLTTAIGELLSVFRDVAQVAEQAERLINMLGWALPDGVDDIGLADLELSDFLDKLRIVLESTPEELEDEALMARRIADLATAMSRLIDDLQQLADDLPVVLSGFGDYVSRTNIHIELPRRILDLLVTHYLLERSLLSFSLLNVLNIIELKHFEADAANFQLEHVRTIVHYHHLHALLSDPVGHMQAAYGWGTPDFDARDLLSRLSLVLQAIGADATVQFMDRPTEEALLGHAVPEADSDPAPRLLINFVAELADPDGPMLGLSIFGVRPSAPGASDGGMGMTPIIRGQVDGEIPLHAFEDVTFEFSVNAELLTQIALIVRSGQAVQINKAPGLGDLGAGKLNFGLRHGDLDSEPTTLLNFPGGSSLSMKQFNLRGGVEIASDGSADSFLEIGLQGCQLTFSMSEADGFLADQVPLDQLGAPFDIGMGWSSRKGIYFHGAAGLNTTLPLRVNLGLINLDLLHIALNTHDEGFEVEASTSGKLALGPVIATVDRLGLDLDVSLTPGNLGPFGMTPAFKPPSGVGLAIDGGGISGNGYLFFDAEKEEYAGLVQLTFNDIEFQAIGLLTTRLPGGASGFSLILIITAEGFTPISLGLGFNLVGVGGLIGINRSVAVDVLRAGLKTKALDAVLFPDDPVENAPAIISNLRAVFPPTPDQYVIGPVARITWGAQALLTADLGLIVEFPDPVRLVLLGQIRSVLPNEQKPLIRLNMDMFGVIDFDKGEALVLATLYDSKLVGFDLSGDIAFYARWQHDPTFILSAGGFHPSFPTPAELPRLDRLALNLTRGDALKLRMEWYFALTSNTVQFGSLTDLRVKKSKFSVNGHLSYDTLIQLDPFGLLIDFSFGVALKWGSHTLAAVLLEGSLTGPNPWHVQGKATFKIWIFSKSVRFDLTVGQRQALPPLPIVDPLPQLRQALAEPGSWETSFPQSTARLVALREPIHPGTVMMHPLGAFSVRQQVVPLNTTLTKFGNARLASPTLLRIDDVYLNGNLLAPASVETVADYFSPGQFEALSQHQQLLRPSFETMPAGIRMDLESVTYGGEDAAELLCTTNLNYETRKIGVGGALQKERRVTSTHQDDDGDILALCNPGMAWSPRSRADVIADIQSGTYRYYVQTNGHRVGIHVVNGPTGTYLRTNPDPVSSNNLDDLPIELAAPVTSYEPPSSSLSHQVRLGASGQASTRQADAEGVDITQQQVTVQQTNYVVASKLDLSLFTPLDNGPGTGDGETHPETLTYTNALAVLRQYELENPKEAGTLQVIAAHEL